MCADNPSDQSGHDNTPGCSSSVNSFASTSKGTALSSAGRGAFAYSLNQFGSLGDLSQLTKYQYLQQFSRLYVATPEPQSSNASNDSQSEPFCLTVGSARSPLASGSSGGSSGSNLTSNNLSGLAVDSGGAGALGSVIKEQTGDSSSSSNVGGMQTALISGQDSNSNDGNGNNFMGSFGNKDAPLCTKCKLHGIRNEVKGHKKSCPMKDCQCCLCKLTEYGKRLRGKKAKKLTLAGEEVIVSLGKELRLSDQPEMFQNNVTLIVEMLKERLQKDGLDYQQEIDKLRNAVVYLLFQQIDKRKLYSKFIN